MRDVQKDVQLLDMVSMAYVGVQEHCPHSLGFSYIYFVLTLSGLIIFFVYVVLEKHQTEN